MDKTEYSSKRGKCAKAGGHVAEFSYNQQLGQEPDDTKEKIVEMIQYLFEDSLSQVYGICLFLSLKCMKLLSINWLTGYSLNDGIGLVLLKENTYLISRFWS